MFHYRVHKSPPLARIPSQMNPIYIQWNLHLKFSDHNFYAILIPSMHATSPAFHILLGLIILIIFGEAYKLRGSSASRHLPSFRFKYFNHPFINVLSLYSPFKVRHQVSHPYKNNTKHYSFVCFNP